MASLATYAKLIPPAQFMANEEVTIRLHYSEDLAGKYGTLIIDGYSEFFLDGREYTGTKKTHYLGWAYGGQWLADYIIPGNTLGISYPDTGTDTIGYSGKMQARVEIGDELDEDGHVINPVFTSNVILVDMLVCRSECVWFVGAPYRAFGSTCSVQLNCDHIINYGASGGEDVQSYRVLLYDSNYNLIQDSEEQYNWDSNVYGTMSYLIRNLEDNKSYYVKGKVSLNSGHSFTTDYVPLTVHYQDVPAGSEEFTLTPKIGNMKMTLDLTGVSHTKVIFSRAVNNEFDYLELAKVENPNDIVEAIDKYPIAHRDYIYRAVVFNGDLIVGTYYRNTTFTSNYVTISDLFGSFSAVGKITKHPINRNDRGSILETMDTKYPYHILVGDADYDSGQVDGLFTTVDDECNIETDNAAYATYLRSWLNNGRAKLLTYYTGEAWIVTVTGVSTTDPENNDVYNTSFNWTAIGDADLMSEYVRLGLVLSE